ncbi:hypothetical protein [Paenibacillus piri]|uniref:DUF4367 domain-containing protein n=1 Tax=Paenibacillus piri TaxID=2547395 RepID=A0A4R5KVL7_9BACL|nr:hypothetical protein [Paenibacillus piri]TDF99198.1 hypothetical protein E1757_04865 [Paenibacillus piri]
MSKPQWEDEFERLFEEAAEDSERFQPVSIPDPSASWLRLQKRLKKERRRAGWIRRAKWASLSAASVLAGAFLFSTLQTTEAFRPMFEIVYKATGSGISIRSTDSMSTAGAKTPPPPPDDSLPPQKPVDNRDLPEGGSFRRIKVSLEDAVSQTQFAMQKPAYIPAGYTFQEAVVHLSIGESKASAVRLVYRSGDSAQTPLTIIVRKRSYSDRANLPDGRRAVTTPANGVSELEWNEQDRNAIVKAELSEQELNRIADGLSAKP